MTQEKIKQLAGIGYVNLATLVWSSNMVIGRMMKDSAGPLTLSAMRFSVAALFFFLLLRQLPRTERRIGKEYGLLSVMALTGVILFSPLLYLGLHYTTAVNATIINGSGPLITGIFAAVFLREPMSGRQIGGAVLALMGVLYLISGGSFDFWQEAKYNIGDILVLAAVSAWGVYSVLAGRVMRVIPAISATAYSMFIGLPVLCVLAVWELNATPVSLDWKGLAFIFYLGIGPAAIGYYAWNQGVSRLGASGAMVFYNTLPLYGALLSSLFLGEPVGMHHAVGAFLIIGGGLWASRKRTPGAK